MSYSERPSYLSQDLFELFNKFFEYILLIFLYIDKKIYVKKLTIFRMGFFGAAHGWVEGAKKAPTAKNLSHISYNDETWHSYILPPKNPKNI